MSHVGSCLIHYGRVIINEHSLMQEKSDLHIQNYKIFNSETNMENFIENSKKKVE